MNLVRGNAMKKLLLGTAMAMATVTGAVAADLALVKVPTPVWGWTGCYVGANVGAGFSRIPTSDVTTAPPTDTGTITNSGIVGGGQVGCDYQLADRWVVGVEGEFEAANISGSAIIPGSAPAIPFESRIPWIVTATARLGYLFAPETLVYARGGGAWSRYNLEIDFQPPPIAKATDNRSGWTVGAGVEQKFWPNVSGFVEYNYLDFGVRTVPFLPVGSAPHAVAENIHEVLVGLNFRFGGAPTATRY
jgi:outer membrane immunogenic protein